ncbi:MAG: M1 family aminopeptidase [Acidobacteriota bacterium]|nr:M1 family aminopeptidase [Acidobacteriota bacterium]MDH3784975.1 M1 family aminopeptidase [Acidobacteriota bacterium]
MISALNGKGKGPLQKRRQTGILCLGLSLLLGLVLAGPARAADEDPASLYAAILDSRLNPDEAVILRNQRLVFGEAILQIEDGVLIPAHPIGGRVLEFLFLGQAHMLLETPDPIEAGQLELFTGRRTFDADIEAAVIATADRQRSEELLARPRAGSLQPSIVTRAQRIYRELLRRSDFGMSGAEESLLKTLLDDSAYSDYFGMWCRSHEMGDFVYQLDPEDVEPLTLMRFNTIESRGWDRMRLARHLKISQRRGRWLGLTVDDLGAWDIWAASRYERPEDPLPRTTGFEAEHYKIQLSVEGTALKLSGRATIDLRVESSGRRAIPLTLFRDLVVDRVADGSGRELFHFRSGSTVAVVLPKPSVEGTDLRLNIEYSGRALSWVGRGTFALEDTSAWHPHIGSVDRATYDVRIRHPRRLQLVASGRLVESGRGHGYHWERRTLDTPAIAFSFLLGRFEMIDENVDGVDLRVAVNANLPRRLTQARRDGLVKAVRESLDFFKKTFGPYPLDYLTVATLPRDYSQSYLGFITLSQDVLVGGVDEQGRLSRESTVAHELAHQWWGNHIGWWSYRDQWLSEAMANYAAMLFETAKTGRSADSLAAISAGWRESLSQTTLDGYRLDALGPVVLGTRLNSSKAGDGYRAIVYRKGAVVLAMLARAVGHESFQEMLRSFTEAAGNRVITTEVFVEAIERMSGLNLSGFADQFIYGTGIADIYYDYEVGEDDEGGARVTGIAHDARRPTFLSRLVRSTGDGWDIEREPLPQLIPGAPSLMVPYRIVVETADRDATDRSGDGRYVRNYFGRQLILQRGRTDFAVPAPARPVTFQLDPLGEIFARFYPADEFPKTVARFRAQNLLADGETEKARAAFREALDQPAAAKARTGQGWLRPPDLRERETNARIHLELARLALDQGDDAQGVRHMQAADELLDPTSNRLTVARATLSARRDLLRGDYAAVRERLKKTLRYLDPGRRTHESRAMLWRIGASTERLELTEAYAMLAVAAYETGHQEDLDWALTEARERGADVELLEGLLIER